MSWLEQIIRTEYVRLLLTYRTRHTRTEYRSICSTVTGLVFIQRFRLFLGQCAFSRLASKSFLWVLEKCTVNPATPQDSLWKMSAVSTIFFTYHLKKKNPHCAGWSVWTVRPRHGRDGHVGWVYIPQNNS